MEEDRPSIEYEDINEKYSKDFLKHLYEDSFLEVVKRTKQVESEHERIIERLDYMNKLLSEQTKSQENYKKCFDYCQKTIRLKKELLALNKNCIQLKKRAIQLREKVEEKKTRSIMEKEREIEEEKRLYPVFNPQSNLLKASSNSKLAGTATTTTTTTITSTTATAITIKTKEEKSPNSQDYSHQQQQQSNAVPEAAISSTVVTTMKITKKHRHKAKPNTVEPTIETNPTNNEEK